MSIRDQAARGELDGLKAIRDTLADHLEIAEPSYSAQIAARLESVLKRIAELDTAGVETVEDALAARRREREANRKRPAQRRDRKSGS